MEFRNLCWKFDFTQSLNYQAAQASCKTSGSDVASIRSVYDASFVTRYVANTYKYDKTQRNLWIGYYKQSGRYSQFHWQDGSCGNYTSWGCGEPNNAGWSSGEDCTHYQFGPAASSTGTWNDASCTSTYNFVCSAPLPSSEWWINFNCSRHKS